MLLHRFDCHTKDRACFCVQVRKNACSGRLDFMSIFDRKTALIKKSPEMVGGPAVGGYALVDQGATTPRTPVSRSAKPIQLPHAPTQA